MKNKKGIALILAIGVLAVLAVIATSFALNMRLEYKAAVNYSNGVRARYLAEAALQRAIAELKEEAMSNAFDELGEDWAGGYSDDISSTATSTIVDEQRRINVNKANSTLLENLFSQLPVSDKESVSNVIEADGLSGDGYNNLQELKSIAEVGETDFDKIKDYLTAHSYVDTSTDRSPININTADLEVLKAVLNGLSDGTTTISDDSKIVPVITAITNARPITSWSEFDSVIDGVGAISGDEPTIIKDNCNPNRSKPSIYTTEFCFNSGGYYEIEATGTVTDASGTVATKTLTAIVKIYGIYNETTEEVFDGGTTERTTWFDSCPIDSNALFDTYTESFSDSMRRPGSIKLGFWDDFEDSGYSDSMWTPAAGTCVVSGGSLDLSNSGKYVLTDANNTAYDDLGQFSLRVFEDDDSTGVQMKHVGWILFWGQDAGNDIDLDDCIAALHAKSGRLKWSNTFAWNENASSSCELVKFTQTGYGKHEYGPQVRMFENAGTDLENEYHDRDDDRTSLSPHSNSKVHNIIAGNGTATLSIYPGGVSFQRTGIGTTSGKIGLYADSSTVEWDDIRIIPPDGNYESKSIGSTEIPELADGLEWGTITASLTVPSSASDPSRSSFPTFTIDLSTDAGGSISKSIDCSDSVSIQQHITAQINSPTATTSPLKYTIDLTTTDTKETPILEDITITYLPKVEVLSWKVE